MARKIVSSYTYKSKKKRPGVHSKNRHTKQTSGNIIVGDYTEVKEDKL